MVLENFEFQGENSVKSSPCPTTANCTRVAVMDSRTSGGNLILSSRPKAAYQEHPKIHHLGGGENSSEPFARRRRQIRVPASHGRPTKTENLFQFARCSNFPRPVYGGVLLGQ